MFFRVSEAPKGNHTYWTELHEAIADRSAIAAMVHDLLRYDLSTFNPRMRPCGLVLIDQKLRSLTGFARFWFEVLQGGDFNPGSDFEDTNPWRDPTFVSTTSLKAGWKTFEGSARQFTPRQEREIHDQLSRLCPSANRVRSKRNGCQQRGFELPALPAARAEFEKFVGGSISWPD